MAFQPIVDVQDGSVYAYEALVRGPQGESAASMLAQVNRVNRHAFDQHCRVKAITLAGRLDLAKSGARLSINIMPGVVHRTKDCIQLAVETAKRFGFPCERLIFEISENEELDNAGQLGFIAKEFRGRGFMVAIDDFGVGTSGLTRLAILPTDMIKIDMKLTRNLGQRRSARAIVRCLVELAKSLGNELVAEGIETVEEYVALRRCGVTLMQGYLFARPAFESLPQITLPPPGPFALAA